MPTARSIVTLALRKLGRVGSGREPRPVDATDGFEALVSLYRGWINAGTFGRLRDVVPTGSYVATGNERILRMDGAQLEVSLPEVVAAHPDERRCCLGTIVAFTVDGAVSVSQNQRLLLQVTTPRDLAPIVITDTATGNVADYVYDGSMKKWVPLWNLDIDDEAPLSFRNSDGLASCLAVKIADQFGADIPATTALSANSFQASLATGFSNPRQEVQGVYF